ncbi:MAG: stage III sporulation AC/AD family protein [Clostridiales bacterium]|nr:stage III sporulation AC/AD family protein [Clostridiales bacterium]
MDTMMKAAAIAVVGSILAAIVKRDAGVIALAVALICCCTLVSCLLGILKPLLRFLEELRQTSGLSTTILSPLLKSVAIGLITEVASGICSDAGQSSLAKFVQLCGAAAALYVALPLMEAILSMLQSLNGG